MAGRFLRPTSGSSGTGAFPYTRTLLLMLVIITTITVLFIEVASFRPPRWARGQRSDINREPIFFGRSAVSVTGGSGRKTGNDRGRTVIGGRTLGPRSIHRKHSSYKEVENAGLDDFWAAGFGDAETDLEGGDVLVVEKSESFVISVKNASSPQLFGRFRDRSEELVGSPNVETVEGRVMFWQVPPGEPTGVILLAQGRNEQADAWWLQSSECSACSGPPPSVAITEAALRRGYAVVTLDNGHWSREIPYNEKELTWDNRWPLEKNHDVKLAASILKRWRRREGLSGLPLHCLGISGGARFCSMLSHVAPVAAQALYMHPGNGQAISRHPALSGGPYPPSLFVHMPRHHELNALLKRSMEKLTSFNVTVGLLELYPVRVTEDRILEDMGRYLTKDETAKLYETMKAQEWLDEDNFVNCPNGLLRTPGYEKLFAAAGLRVTYDVANHLQRVLRQAYALHEVSSDRNYEVLDWLADECRVPDKLRTGARCTELTNEIPDAADNLVFKHEPPC